MGQTDLPTALQVTLHSATQLYDTNFVSKMDPYVVVRVGKVEHKTQPNSSGGTNPRWEETVSFNYTNEEFIRFSVYDKDTLTKDDYVGCSEFPVRHIATSAERSYSGSVPLSRGKGKPAGFLNVTIRFYGSVVDSTQKAGGNQAKQNTPNATEQPPQPCMMYPGQWPNAVAAPPMMGYPPPQAYVRNPGMPMMVPPQGFPMNPPMMAQPAAAMGVYPPQPQQYMQYNPHQPMQPQMPLQQMMMPQGGHPPNQPPGMYPQTMQYMPPQNNGYSPNNGPPKEWQM